MTFLRSTDFAASSSTTRFRLLGKVPAGAAALMLGASALAMMSGGARADCQPDPATAGPDVVTCDAAGGDNSPYTSLGGDDVITITDGTYAGRIFGSSDNDTITLNGAAADVGEIAGGSHDDTINIIAGTVGNVFGDDGAILDGNDFINMDGGAVTGNIDAGGANDTIFLDGGSVGGNVLGGSGNDNIDIDFFGVGVIVTGSVLGGDGNDHIDMYTGGTVGNIDGGANDDLIHMFGGLVLGDILGGSGADQISVNGGTVLSEVLGGTGNDTITLAGGAVGNDLEGEAGDDTIFLLSGSVGDQVFGGSGNDTITLNGASVTNDIDGDDGDDTIIVLAGTAGDNVTGDLGNDTITMNGGSVVGDVTGDEGEDVIALNGGNIGGDVTGGDDNDTITLNGATVTGDTFGGLLGGAGEDLINLDAGLVGAAGVQGGEGNDTINLDGATVAFIWGDGVAGGAGDDIINLNSGTVTNGLGGVIGGEGNDTITVNGAVVDAAIWAGTGDDTITVLAGSVGTDVNGDAGNDIITLNGGVVGAVDGGLGNDTITLNGGSIVGDLHGGDDDDVINLFGGTVGGNVLGDVGPGDDTILLAGTTVIGNIEGEAGNDTITLDSGSVGGAVLGGDDNDTISLSGASVAGNIAGDAGDDIISLTSGSAGASVAGNGGNDTITLAGAAITGALQGGTGDDIFTLTSGSFGDSLLGDDGSDTVTIESTFDLSTITAFLDGGDNVSTADGFIDLLTIQAGGTLTGDNILNWEEIDVDGVTLTLEGAGLTTGNEDVFLYGLHVFNGGTIDFDDGFDVTGDVGVFDTSTLVANDGAGSYSVSGDFVLDGTLNMSDGVGPNDVFTVGGDFDGGGDLLMDVALDATEQGDLLVLNNNFFDLDTTFITFTDTMPLAPGSFTGTGPGNGIPVVDNSAGGLILDSDFALDPVAHPTDEILKVPFVYMLNLESDDILYLQSDVLAQVYGYAILAELTREDMPALRERLGERRYNGFSGDGTDNSGAAGGGVGWDNGGIWARIEGGKRTNEHEGDFTTGEWDASRVEAEVGVDIPMDVGGGLGVFGVSAHFIQGFANANSGLTPDPDIAEVDTTGFGAGLSFAYFPGGGFYADVQGRLTAWDADVEVDNRNIDQDVNAIGWGASLEVGNRIGFGNTAVTPRGRAVYTDVNFKSFTDDDGVDVSQDDSASVVIEGGVTVEQMFPDNGVSIFADASVSHDLLRDSSIDASGFTFESGLEDTWGTLSIGGSMETGQGTSAYIAADVSSPFGSTFGDSIGYGLRAGIRVDF